MAKRSPRARDGEPKRVPVSTKLLPALRDMLEEAAAAEGRTLGNEIERRLERSFLYREIMAERLGGDRAVGALEAIAQSWKLIKLMTRQEWWETHENLRMAQVSAQSVLELVKTANGDPLYKQDLAGSLSEIGKQLDRSQLATMLAHVAINWQRGKYDDDDALNRVTDFANQILGDEPVSKAER